MQLVEVLLQNVLSFLIAFVDDAAYLRVDLFGRLVGHGLVRLGGRATEKYLFATFIVHQRPHLLRQPPLGHHIARDFRGALDVVGGSGGNALGAQRHLFRDTATEQAANLTDDVPPAV